MYNLLPTTPIDPRLKPIVAHQNLVRNIANGVMIQPTDIIGENKIVHLGRSYAHDVCLADIMFANELDDPTFLQRAQLHVSQMLN